MRTRRVTIKDIAVEAGCSIALVSFVMNNEANGREIYRVNKNTAQRILEVAARLNYIPNSAARTLRCGRTNTIGVILSDISNKFFADIARCIEDRAYKYNYTVLFGSTDENAGKLHNLIEVFVNKGVDGLIIVPCENADMSIKSVVERQIPMVLLDREVPGTDMNCVVLNNFKAGAQAASALLDRGCRKIEMISYSMNLSSLREREDGFRYSMSVAGLSVDGAIHRLDHGGLDDIGHIIKDARERGTEGLLFGSNTLALAGLKEISHNGWTIPDDFAVAMFDGNEIFEVYNTDIPYIQQPKAQFGREAVDMLLRSIECKAKGEPLTSTRIILAPQLVTDVPDLSAVQEAQA